MFGPAMYTEGDALVGYLDAQLASLRAAAHGLTDEPARATPCRSALSVGGLIKHATYVLGNRDRHRRDPEAMPTSSVSSSTAPTPRPCSWRPRAETETTSSNPGPRPDDQDADCGRTAPLFGIARR